MILLQVINNKQELVKLWSVLADHSSLNRGQLRVPFFILTLHFLPLLSPLSLYWGGERLLGSNSWTSICTAMYKISLFCKHRFCFFVALEGRKQQHLSAFDMNIIYLPSA